MKIIILTAEPSNFVPEELKKEAEALGHEVSIINPNDCYISVSDDPYISYKGTKLMDADICIPRLSENNFEYKLTIIKHLENMGMFVLNSAESMRLASDKLESQIIMNSNKFKTPKSAMMTNDSQLDYVAASLDDKFPMILKKVSGTHGIGVMKVDSMSSYKSVAQSIISDGVKFMVQEYIEHDQSARIITIGDKILCANLRGQPKAEDGEKGEKKDFRTNSHLGSKTEQYNPPEHEVKMALELAKLFGTRFCAVDYIPGETPVILEVNGSPGLENIQKDYPDRNLAKEVIEYCINNHKAEPDNVKPEEDDNKDSSDKSSDKNTVDITKQDNDAKNVVGDSSNVILKRFNDNKAIDAKIDTGAGICSIHGDDIEIGDNFVKFKYGDTRYKVSLDRKIYIKSSDGGKTTRPIVKFDVTFNGSDYENIDFTVTDRGHMKYDVLIGRNLLIAAGTIIDLSSETEEE